MSIIPWRQHLKKGITWVGEGLHATIGQDLQTGRLRLHDLSGDVRMLSWVIIVVLGLATIGMLFGTQLRKSFDMVAIDSNSTYNGILIPNVVVGIILFGISLAWSIMLSAIRGMPTWIRVIGGTFHGILILTWLAPLLQNMQWYSVLMLALMLSILLFQTITVFRFRQNHIVQTWLVIYICEILMLAIPHAFYYQNYLESRIGLLFGSVAQFIQTPFALIFPMLMLVGINMAGMALHISDWALHSSQSQRRTHSSALIVWLLIGIRFGWLSRTDLPEWSVFVVTTIYIAGLFIGMWVLTRLLRRSDVHFARDIPASVLTRYGKWFVLVEWSPLLLQIVTAVVFGGIMLAVGPQFPAAIHLFDTIQTIIGQGNVPVWVAFCVGLSWYIWRLWQRQQYAMALVFVALCYHGIWRIVNYLALVELSAINIEATLFVICTVWYIWQRWSAPQHTQHISAMLWICVCSMLLAQADFLNNPLSPVLGFAGVFFVALGIWWDTTFGAHWVNQSNPTYPREQRVAIYLGYCLLTAVIVFWASVSHNDSMQNIVTGELAYRTLYNFGTPVIQVVAIMSIFGLIQPPSSTH